MGRRAEREGEMMDADVAYIGSYRKGRLGTAKIAHGATTVDLKAFPNSATVRMNTCVGLHQFEASEAYYLGMALIEMAKDCGYDEDTGETRSS